MSLIIPCGSCGRTNVGKLSSATWAWWNADNVRVAWRQNLCVDCYVTNVAVLETSTRENPVDCPVCHSAPGEQLDPCYLTIFIPGVGPVRLEMATCAPCAVEVRVRAQQGSRKLEDRRASSEGLEPGPQTDPALAVWKALGIAPRE